MIVLQGVGTFSAPTTVAMTCGSGINNIVAANRALTAVQVSSATSQIVEPSA